MLWWSAIVTLYSCLPSNLDNLFRFVQFHMRCLNGHKQFHRLPSSSMVQVNIWATRLRSVCSRFSEEYVKFSELHQFYLIAAKLFCNYSTVSHSAETLGVVWFCFACAAQYWEVRHDGCRTTQYLIYVTCSTSCEGKRATLRSHFWWKCS